MREIRFRAWDAGIKKMTYDNFVVDAKGKLSFHWQPDMFNSTRSILMQYTGLKDKNGKEIYEGDVVNVNGYGKSKIVWNESVCCFQFEYESIMREFITNTLYDFEVSGKFEIIGNIYENPDLLK